MPNNITIIGKVIDIKNEEGVPKLRVEAWDKDFVSKHFISYATTDTKGNFKLTFDQIKYASLYKDKNPDVYFKVFDGERLLASTEREVYWNMNESNVDIVIKVFKENIVSTDQKVFTGKVFHTSKNVVVGINVSLYSKQLGGETYLSSVTTDKNGDYFLSIPKKQRPVKKQSTLYIIKVLDENNIAIAVSGVLETPLQESKLNFIISDEKYKGNSHFEKISKMITPYIKKTQIAKLGNEGLRQEYHYLSKKSGLPKKEVELYVKSQKLSLETNISPEIFYSLLKSGFSGRIEDLMSINPKTIQKTLDTVKAANLVASQNIGDSWQQVEKIKEALVDKVLEDANENQNENIAGLLKIVFPKETECKTVLKKYALEENKGKIFWESLKTELGSEAENKISDIKKVLKLGTLTGGQKYITQELFNLSKELDHKECINKFISFDAEDIKEIITKVSREKKTLCVPSYINGKSDADKIHAYSEAISLMLSKSFPTEAFAARLAKPKNQKGVFSKTYTDLIKFISQNKSFKFEDKNLVSFNENNYNFDSIKDKTALTSEIKSLNRIFKLVSDFDQVSCLKELELDSSFKISLMEKATFLEKTKNKIGVSTAGNIYNSAMKISKSAYQMLAKLHPELGKGLTVVPGIKDILTSNSDAEATWRTMFGGVEQVEVEESKSITSPAAYLADILHFLENHNKSAFDEFKRRRKDILHLFLNHDNTMTPMPYVDIVIERLEDMTLQIKGLTSANSTFSNQTTSSEDEIMAYPENLSEKAYEVLKDEVYPFSLPFNFAIEETRSYLSLLGMERWEITEKFLSFEREDFCKNLAPYDWAIEYLGISPKEGDIITENYFAAHQDKPWLLYGLDAPQNFTPIKDPCDPSKTITGEWTEVLSGRLDIFLLKTGLSYIELLTFLDMQFINPGKTKTVSITSSQRPDCADLSKMKIQGMTKEILHKFNRLVRLWRKLDIPLCELDVILKALNIKLDNSNDLINLAFSLYIIRNFNIPVEEAVAFWGNINVYSYKDYNKETQPLFPSLFSKLFDKKSVQGEVPSVLKQLMTPSKKVELIKCKDELTSSLGIGIDKLDSILEALGYVDESTIGITGLSHIYRHFKLSKVLGVKVIELQKLIALTATDPFENPISCYQFIEKYTTIIDNGFSFENIECMLVKKSEDIGSSEAQIFINQLKKDLQALLAEPQNISNTEITDIETISAYIIQQFSTKTRCHIELVEAVLKNAESFRESSENILTDFTNIEFINYSKEINFAETSESTEANGFLHLFEAYARITKTVSLILKLNISKSELECLYSDAKYLKILNFNELPIVSDCMDVNKQYRLFERLMNLLKTRKQIKDSANKFISLHLDALKTGQFDLWLDSISTITNYSKGDIRYLVASPEGIFNVSFPEDFKDGSIIQKMISILKLSEFIGIKVDSLLSILEKDVTIEKVSTLRKACSGKFSENDWYQRAKTVRNTLRDKQRKVLVDYVVTNPVASKKQYWTNNEELFEYLLLDVEVTSKVITSRLKQAIGSVQLFVDRILMNLERKDMSLSLTPFTLDEDSVKEWMSWRKNYRVWEANRKIFLYPENWIEPELRDDKSPFFKEFESQLKQSNLSNEAVEDAFFKYLEKLDDVAFLDIRCFYKQTDQDIVHVIGKNRSMPAKYYYRKRIDSEWAGWEPLGLEIFSDQIATIFWNRRLYLFWLECFEEPEMGDVSLPSFEHGGTVKKSRTRLKIQLAWSYLWQNRWCGKHLSSNSIYTDYYENISMSEIQDSLFLSTQFSGTKLLVRPLTATKYSHPGITFIPKEGVERVYVSLGEKFVFYDCTGDPQIESDNYVFTNEQLLIPENTTIHKMHIEGQNVVKKDSSSVSKIYSATTDKG